MNDRYVWGKLMRVGISVLGAGFFHTAWLAVFILTSKLESRWIRGARWILVPMVTAAGFTVGVQIFDHFAGTRKNKFLHVYFWPLIGCAIGAIAAFSFGPMLIGFGTFGAGTASMLLREFALTKKR
jgi:predicted anti-sigma-YlaC factor YlaD